MPGFNRNQSGGQGAMRGNQGFCRRAVNNDDSTTGGVGRGMGGGRCRATQQGGQGGRGLGLGRGNMWQSQQGGLQQNEERQITDLTSRKEALQRELRELENQIERLGNQQ